MLIERKPTAVKILSVRTDVEAFEGLQALSAAINSSPSVLLRLAIHDLLCKQKTTNATSVAQLMATKE